MSNLPQNIRSAIKARPISQIQQKIDELLGGLPASLMADTSLDSEQNGLTSAMIVPNASVGHDGVAQDSIPQVYGINLSTHEIGISQVHIPKNFFQEGTSEVGITQISTFQTGLPQGSTSQISIPQVGTAQMSLSQFSTLQTGISQINTSNLATQNTTAQAGATQISSSQIDASLNRTAQISTTQINTAEVNIAQINTSQLNSSKISLPSSIPSQQLFSIHTLTPESITTINDTAQTLWNTGLAPQTAFDINLQLTDSLAKGQLAEAIVTKYDAEGRPIGGTIEVDPTANGTVAVHRLK